MIADLRCIMILDWLRRSSCDLEMRSGLTVSTSLWRGPTRPLTDKQPRTRCVSASSVTILLSRSSRTAASGARWTNAAMKQATYVTWRRPTRCGTHCSTRAQTAVRVLASRCSNTWTPPDVWPATPESTCRSGIQSCSTLPLCRNTASSTSLLSRIRRHFSRFGQSAQPHFSLQV